MYARLPAEPELSIVRRHLVGLRRVLDLGAGTGRIADPLVAAGHDVLAVDESPRMLAHVRWARTRCARIQGLELAERFDAALLLSYLVNDPDDRERRRLVAAAARALRPGGTLVIQRHDPSWSYAAGHARTGDVEVALTEVDVGRWPTVSACTVYRIDDQHWSQPWRARVLDDDETGVLLRGAGLGSVTFAGSWVTAARQ